MKEYPTTDRIPAHPPIKSAPKGWTGMDAAVPIATPPASVAFCTCSMVILRPGVAQMEVA